MMKVAINGFGRIGRALARLIAKRNDMQLVAINDTATIDMTVYLLRQDSVHRPFDDVELLGDNTLKIGNDTVQWISDRDPSKLKFASLGAELVFECTGSILSQDKAKIHLDDGIKKVIFSAPAKDETPTFVYGVNHHLYKGEDIISNASCTTNCLAPLVQVLDKNLGIQKGLMTTTHSYTNDQNILDVKHKKDKRRSRAAALNIIPTSTGAAKAIGLVLPHLQGKLHGQALRVPTPNVSIVDLNVIVDKPTDKESVNALLQKASQEHLKGV